jgi:hypothetical protein
MGKIEPMLFVRKVRATFWLTLAILWPPGSCPLWGIPFWLSVLIALALVLGMLLETIRDIIVLQVKITDPLMLKWLYPLGLMLALIIFTGLMRVRALKRRRF